MADDPGGRATGTGDGLTDLVMLDHEGYLALFERTRSGGELALLPGKRIFIGEQGSRRSTATASRRPARLVHCG